MVGFLCFMAEEGQVAESVQETAEATPITTENVWDTPLEFPQQTVVEKEDESSPSPESDSKEEPVAEEVAEEPKEEVQETAPEPTDEPDDDVSVETQIDPDRPAPLSRRKKEEVVKKVIDPFRDPNTPPDQVFTALYELNPNRAEALAQEIARISAEAYPDEWLKTILGEDVTVQQVKERLAGTPNQVLPESNPFDPVIQALDQTYGDVWKDGKRDDEILDEDLPYVKAVRQHLAEAEVRAANDSLKDKEIEALKTELEKLKPEIDSIKTSQQAKFEKDVEDTYSTTVREFQSSIEQKSLDKLFKDSGLNPSEGDTPDVKALKELIKTRFDREQSGDFDYFVSNEFSDREAAAKVIARVDRHYRDAAQAEIEASLAKGEKAQQLKQKANSLRAEAQMEKDRLTVLHRKAAQEFLNKLSPMMKVLEENADLKRRVSQTRPEIIGNTVTNAPDWKKKIQESDDPWAVNDGWGQLAVGR